MAVASAGPYTYLHLSQTDNHASIPPLTFLQAGCPSCHPTNSVKALKASPVTSSGRTNVDVGAGENLELINFAI